MSKRRAAAKYGAAGMMTTVYAIGAYRVLTADRREQTTRQALTPVQVGTAVGISLGLTWLATLL